MAPVSQQSQEAWRPRFPLIAEIPFTRVPSGRFISSSMAQTNAFEQGPIPKNISKSFSVRDKPRHPLQYSGSLDNLKSFDITPIIGREFRDVQLSTLLKDDAKIQDLAILGNYIQYWSRRFDFWQWVVSQRGVVFFRSQDLKIEEQKVLGQKLGILSGKPKSSQVCAFQSLIFLIDLDACTAAPPCFDG